MKRCKWDSNARGGTVVVFTAVTITVLLGACALAVDLGYAYSVQAQLQRNADAAALAGTSAIVSDNLLSDNPQDPTVEIVARIEAYALANPSGGVSIHIRADDILPGSLADPYNPNEPVAPTSFELFNAVQVSVRRDESINGSISAFFAGIFGVDSIPLSASATAIVLDGFAGFRPPPSEQTSPLLPFTIHKDLFQSQLDQGLDLFGWDSSSQQIISSPDGIREIRIFPAVVDVGNFGTLNIGVGNQGTQQLGSQIQHGLTENDLIDEIGTPNISFLDDGGQFTTYTITGNPGISGGLVSYVELRLGDLVGFFLHDETTANGSNYEYRITSLRFGRLLEIDLTGNPSDKRLVLQPVVYDGPGVQTDPDGESSEGLVVGIRLVR